MAPSAQGRRQGSAQRHPPRQRPPQRPLWQQTKHRWLEAHTLDVEAPIGAAPPSDDQPSVLQVVGHEHLEDEGREGPGVHAQEDALDNAARVKDVRRRGRRRGHRIPEDASHPPVMSTLQMPAESPRGQRRQHLRLSPKARNGDDSPNGRSQSSRRERPPRPAKAVCATPRAAVAQGSSNGRGTCLKGSQGRKCNSRGGCLD
eukprot:CAMPEP_0180467734 /NCGR_PEP_ID=MMETSP1036_2-20121128/27157_1 /TAXON_ID=632150 /ORGANISM="Azadinium spinosum, Strain 3D9" /LENGTH=201 /DNA_ID=CAMNT_0022474715 /DNA_START=267 /DNA_END=871 /DNA_ORIENTATION=+